MGWRTSRRLGVLKEYCARFPDAAAGGSVLVRAVEEMPAIVQDADRASDPILH
jgi:hypothetical protein